MLKASSAHLAEVGESYFEHMRFALLVGALATGAGLACVLHAVVPALCQTTCSRTVASLQELFADRGRLPRVAADSSGVLIFVVLLLISFVTAAVVAFCTLQTAIGLILVPQAFALPLIYLWQNTQLDPIEAAS
jgi:hypothetical protein